MVARSRRQYTKGLNNPALLAVSGRKEAKGSQLLPFIQPCLAELRDNPPSTDHWVHEIKFDGYRLQIRIQDEKVNCYTRARGRLAKYSRNILIASDEVAR
jgi:ATP-dependent DNA ligase